MIGKIKNLISTIRKQSSDIDSLLYQINTIKNAFSNDIKSPKVTIGKLLSNQNNNKESIKNLFEVEFQVFSQWGDDGIIQYLINKIDLPHKTFIEFGVEKYVESNTRFLLINNNWSGLIMDGSKENMEYVKNDEVYWMFDIYAQDVFITKENINQLLKDSGFEKELGILSIDIDGNDYWVWKEINEFKPIIVISEYNSLFGYNNPWTIPYKADFVRPHHDNKFRLFYGSSLLSLCDLAEEKGYSFIGCNSNGNNAYFVRKDRIGNFKALTAKEGYVKSKFREVLLETGRLQGNKRFDGIINQEVYNTRKNVLEKIPNSIDSDSNFLN